MDSVIGSLEAGKRADVILLDMGQSHLTRSYNIYSSLIYNPSGSDVTDSIIDGRINMLNRQLLTLSESEVLRMAKTISDRLRTVQPIAGQCELP